MHTKNRAMEAWLQKKIGPAYDALKAAPWRAISIDKVRARLAAEHKKLTAKA